MSTGIDRRGFVTQAGALMLGGAGVPAGVRASEGEVIVANWGGSWNDRTVKFVEAPLLESKGVKVVRDLAAAPARRTKLLAERALPRATIDVAHVSGADAITLQSQGVWANVDESMVPNLKFVHDKLRSSFFVPWQYSGWVLLYNPARVSEPPRSFADLLNPKYAGKVGMTDIHYQMHHLSAALAAGADLLDTAAAQKWLLELKKAVRPRIYPGHEQLQVALKNEEVWISTNFRSRALEYGHDGVNVLPQFPTEGGVGVIFGACMTKRARNRDNALRYLNAMLDPASMGGLVQESFYAPAVTNAVLSDPMRARLEFPADQQKRLHFPDLARVGQADPGMLEWWNKVFKT